MENFKFKVPVVPASKDSVKVPNSDGQASTSNRQIEGAPPPIKRPKSLFGLDSAKVVSIVLHDCGYEMSLSAEKSTCVHSMDVFRDRLKKWLDKEDDEMCRIENNASIFKRSLINFLTTEENLKKSLAFTKHNEEVIIPSLLHLLLGVERLQDDIVSLVLPLMISKAGSDCDDDTKFVTSIITQMKYLPKVTNAPVLASKLIQVLEIAKRNVQLEVLRSISSIIPSDYHTTLANILLKIFVKNNTGLNVCIMDTFSMLNIDQNVWLDFRLAATEKMATAPLKELSAYFLFLTYLDSADEADQVVSSIRENVVITQETPTHETAPQQIEILDKIENALRMNPLIKAAWLRQIKSCQVTGRWNELRTLDIIVLFALLGERSSAEVLLKRTFTRVGIIIPLVDDLVMRYGVIISHLFQPLSNLLDHLMKLKKMIYRPALVKAYTSIINSVDPFEAQILIRDVTMSIINNEKSRYAAIEILEQVFKTKPNRLLRFYQYLMEVTLHVEKFTAPQTKRIMELLGALSQLPGDDGTNETNNLTSEFSLMVHKQVGSPDMSVRCLGIYGIMANVKSLQSNSPETDKTLQLLNTVWRHVEREPLPCTIFLDELCTAVPVIPVEICRAYHSMLTDSFENRWVLFNHVSSDKIASLSRNKGLSLEAQFDLNLEPSGEGLIISFENQPLAINSQSAPVHLKAIACLEARCEGGSISGISGLLGAPLLIPSIQLYYGDGSLETMSATHRAQLGQYLITAINFTRECLNILMQYRQEELMVIANGRLRQLVQLQKLFVANQSQFPSETFKENCLVNARLQTVQYSSQFYPLRYSRAAKAEGQHSKTGGWSANLISSLYKFQPQTLSKAFRKLDLSTFQLLERALSDDTTFEIAEHHLSTILSPGTQVRGTENAKQIYILSGEQLSVLLSDLCYQLKRGSISIEELLEQNFMAYIITHLQKVVTLIQNEDEDGYSCVLTIFEIIITILKSTSEMVQTLTPQVKAAFVCSVTTGNVPFFTDFMEQISLIIKRPGMGWNLLCILENILKISDNAESLHDTVSRIARTYLCRNWTISHRVARNFTSTMCLTSNSLILQIKEVSESLIRTNANGILAIDSHTFKAITYKNVVGVIKAVMGSLCAYVNKEINQVKDIHERISKWKLAVLIFKQLTNVIKCPHLGSGPKFDMLLATYIRLGGRFVEYFINKAASLVPEMMSSNRAECRTFLKTFQKACRQVRACCDKAKVDKRTRAFKYAPATYRTLEYLVLKMELVVKSVGAEEAFQIFELRHKDLLGNVITSQVLQEPLLSDEDESSSDADSCCEEDWSQDKESDHESVSLDDSDITSASIVSDGSSTSEIQANALVYTQTSSVDSQASTTIGSMLEQSAVTATVFSENSLVNTQTSTVIDSDDDILSTFTNDDLNIFT